MTKGNPNGPPEGKQLSGGDSDAQPEKQGRKFFQRPVVIIAGAALISILCFIGLRYLVQSRSHESTDDAFIEADIVILSPKVSGQVRAVYVTDNEFVRRGDLLVEIDPRDYEALVAEKRAALQSAQTGLESAKANLKVTQSRVNSAQATNAQRQAEADAALAVASRAETDLARDRELLTNKTISPQEFDAARAAAVSAGASAKAANEQIAAARSGVAEARDQVTSAQAAFANAEAQIKLAAADLQTAELNLSYTRIDAPIAGRVTHRAVNPGDYLQVGQNIMALVPQNVYVVANFKETQLRNMRPGQPATITVTAYPGKAFSGHVDSIQAGSGARFSLLPPENAVGNFVKVVQRVPVKILFNGLSETNRVLGPGMSVVPSVRVRNFEVPAWILFVLAAVIGILAVIFWRRASRPGNVDEQPVKPVA